MYGFVLPSIRPSLKKSTDNADAASATRRRGRPLGRFLAGKTGVTISVRSATDAIAAHVAISQSRFSASSSPAPIPTSRIPTERANASVRPSRSEPPSARSTVRGASNLAAPKQMRPHATARPSVRSSITTSSFEKPPLGLPGAGRHNGLAGQPPPKAASCSRLLNGKRYSSSYTPAEEEPNSDQEANNA
jgi:hypothetical protein